MIIHTGGGAGMVMQAEPVYLAWESVVEKLGRKPKVLYMSPQGRVFDQTMAQELAEEEDLLFLCGHYEGIVSACWKKLWMKKCLLETMCSQAVNFRHLSLWMQYPSGGRCASQ